ncbi:hypothetical protein [Thermomonospora echinospora]|uniref:hypothetical protein n=1 Tax=Thermomonospora echinospora TaxID=1992 RepID=UPI001359A9EE|nr:hypothetical protein [Thermomonospora echinospora]
MLVRATEHLDQYRGDAVRRNFEALAPALPVGMPRAGEVAGRRLVEADAADFQEG